MELAYLDRNAVVPFLHIYMHLLEWSIDTNQNLMDSQDLWPFSLLLLQPPTRPHSDGLQEMEFAYVARRAAVSVLRYICTFLNAAGARDYATSRGEELLLPLHGTSTCGRRAVVSVLCYLYAFLNDTGARDCATSRKEELFLPLLEFLHLVGEPLRCVCRICTPLP